MEESKKTTIMRESNVNPQMPNNMEDIIVQTATKEPHGPSKGQTIVLMKSYEDSTIEIDQINFVFGDYQWIARECDLAVHIPCSIVQLSFHAKSDCQQQQCLPSISNWKKKSIAMPISSKEIEEHQRKKTFV